MAEVAIKALQLSQNTDPAVVIRTKVAPFLDQIQIGGPDILVGIFEPEGDATTKGGLLLPEAYRKEYRWQGKSGLVLKIGPRAYKTEHTEGWFADPPKVGDWIMFDVKNAHAFLMGDQPCRLVTDQYVLAKIDTPMVVY